MTFPFNIFISAFAGAFLVTYLTLPAWRAWCVRAGLVDDPGHRKIHTQPTPLAGGLAVMSGLLLPLMAGFLALHWDRFNADIATALLHGAARRGSQLGVLLAGGLGMMTLGLLDDRIELRPAVKFAGQWLIASAVAWSGIRVTLFVPSVVFSYLITVLWILTVTNALNFMDNMNGLCAGLGALGSAFFGLAAAVQGQYLVGTVAWLACGSLLGFLPFNYPRATVFLGDAGSHLVGYWLAVLAILPHFYSAQHQHRWAVISPLLILAVPLGDLAVVVWLRWRLGKPFYVGDNNHLSHRLVRRGCSPTTAVALIWLLATVTGGLAFLLL
jgi:UDP-GlcNAc:undecaprenyl-phosphate/decaprenyl-phosphate GlcNAc-1-phosphate transferase